MEVEGNLFEKYVKRLASLELISSISTSKFLLISTPSEGFDEIFSFGLILLLLI